MCPVVLYAEKRHGKALRRLLRFPRRKIVRMPVADEDGGPDAEQAQVRFQSGVVMIQHGGIFQISDVLAQKSMPFPPGCEGSFLLRTERNHARRVKGQQDGLGSIAAAAAEKDRRAAPKAQDGIVAAVYDGAIVQKIAVRDSRERFDRVLVFDQHRLAGPVGTCENQRVRPSRASVEQEDMQGSIGKKNADRPGCAPLRKIVWMVLFQQDNRTARAFEQ